MSLIRPYTDSARATPMISVGEDGTFSGPRLYILATAGTLTNIGPARGGDYIWACESSNWNAATATLQMLGQDGVTWRNVRNAANTADIAMTANGSVGIGIGQGATLRVSLSGGTPTQLYSNLSGLA